MGKHQPTSTELDSIFTNFLGEYHEHKCPSNCGTGCHNCYNTGYNQTPCMVCDKDGIAFKNIHEAKSAILKDYISRKELLESINKLNPPVWKHDNGKAYYMFEVDKLDALLNGEAIINGTEGDK